MITTDDGTVIDYTKGTRHAPYDIRANGVIFSHAMIPATAAITMEETVKCWNERPGLYTYPRENPFPQYVPDMLAAFPELADGIKTTTRYLAEEI
jgi:hypothetical protein